MINVLEYCLIRSECRDDKYISDS